MPLRYCLLLIKKIIVRFIPNSHDERHPYDQAFKTADTDRSGGIDKAEFIALYAKVSRLAELKMCRTPFEFGYKQMTQVEAMKF